MSVRIELRFDEQRGITTPSARPDDLGFFLFLTIAPYPLGFRRFDGLSYQPILLAPSRNAPHNRVPRLL